MFIKKIVAILLISCLIMSMVSVSADNDAINRDWNGDWYDSSWVPTLRERHWNWDYDSGWRDNVTYRDVPIEVEPNPVPTELSARVVKTYPGGKLKALTFSFDDGGTGAGHADPRMIEVLNRYGYKATFFMPMNEGFGGTSIGSQNYKNRYEDMYDGHEVANHSLDHYNIRNLRFNDFKANVGEQQRRLEEITGIEVAGYAHAGGTNPDENTGEDYTPFSVKLDWMKSIGIRYTRLYNNRNVAPQDSYFNMPDSFYEWDFSMEYTANSHRQAYIDYFIDMDSQNQLKVFHIMAHTDWMNEGQWTSFDTHCAQLKEREDQFWSATLIDIVDYVNASRMLDIKEINGELTIHNPSREITVWVKVLGTDIAIQPGHTYTGDELIDLEYTLSAGSLLDIGTHSQLRGNTLSDDGTVIFKQPNTDSTSEIAKNDSGQIEITQTKASQTEFLDIDNPWLISTDTPTVMEVEYKVELDTEELVEPPPPLLPQVRLGFALPTLGRIGNQMLSTPLFTPSEEDDAEYMTLKMTIDDDKKTLSYIVNEGDPVNIGYDVDISYLRKLRIHPMAIPNAQIEPNPAEATTALGTDTSIVWTFDSVKVYQEVSDGPNVDLLEIDNQAQINNNIISGDSIGEMMFQKPNTNSPSKIAKNDFGQIEFTQTKASQTEFLDINNPWLINSNHPTTIEVRYKVVIDFEEPPPPPPPPLPQARLGFALPTLGLIGNQMLSAPLFTPPETGESGYRTLKMVFDHSTRTLIYSIDGGETVHVPYNVDITYLRKLRIYPMAIPDATPATEAVTPLERAVLWTFNSIKVYQLSEIDQLKVSAIGVKELSNDEIRCTINVKNYGFENKSAFIKAELYDNSEDTPVLVDSAYDRFNNLQPEFVHQYADIFSIEGLSDYFIKTYVVNDLNDNQPSVYVLWKSDGSVEEVYPKYSIPELEWLKIDDMNVTAMADDKIRYTVSVKNYGDGNKGASIVVVLYDNSSGIPKLVNTDTYEINALEPEAVFQESSGEFSVSGLDGDYFVSAFLWSDLVDMTPYHVYRINKADIK